MLLFLRRMERPAATLASTAGVVAGLLQEVRTTSVAHPRINASEITNASIACTRAAMEAISHPDVRALLPDESAYQLGSIPQNPYVSGQESGLYVTTYGKKLNFWLISPDYSQFYSMQKTYGLRGAHDPNGSTADAELRLRNAHVAGMHIDHVFLYHVTSEDFRNPYFLFLFLKQSSATLTARIERRTDVRQAARNTINELAHTASQLGALVKLGQ